jgi:hypothetical protein
VTRVGEALVRDYVEGWLAGDRERILGPLAPDCVIVESHGPMYRGRDVVARWVDGAIADGVTVDRWDVTSLATADGACFFEWDFACTVAGDVWAFTGASVARFDETGIRSLHEYRLTAAPFDWRPDSQG